MEHKIQNLEKLARFFLKAEGNQALIVFIGGVSVFN